MKKILGISLGALFAVAPMMAQAAAVAGDPVSYAANEQPTGAAKDAVLGGTPLYQLAQSATSDTNAASAGYVKGAYNAAIKAVNKVHEEAAAAQSKADSAYALAGSALQSDSSLNGANLQSGTVAKEALSAAVQSSLGAADTALQSAGTGLAQSGTTVSLSSETMASLGKADTALQSDSSLNGANLQSGTVAKGALAVSLQSALDAASSAVQSVTEGSTNGTIAVDGTDVSVHGLGTAAYSAATAFDAAGAAGSALTSANSYTDAALEAYTTTEALQSTYATQTGVAATINTATVAYDIMQTWGSDSATSASYDVSVASYVAE